MAKAFVVPSGRVWLSGPSGGNICSNELNVA